MGLRLLRRHALVPVALAATAAVALALSSSPGGGSPARATTTTTSPSGGVAGPVAQASGSSGSSGVSGSSGASGPSGSTIEPGGSKILSGGTVTVAVPSIPDELNPATVAGANPVTAEIMAQVWPSPFVTARPGNEKASTAFIDSAENVSVSPQKVVYTIDPKARWSNGVPITAADFVAEWRAQLRLGAKLPAGDSLAGYRDIASIRWNSSGRVVTVRFKRPDADWEALFSELAPANVAKRHGWAASFTAGRRADLVSGGPFAITKIVPNKEVVLSRNPHWWGRPPRLDHIVFRAVRGQASLLSGLESGAIDVAEVAPGPVLRDALTEHRNLRASTSLSPTLWQLGFNLGDPTVGQLVVRQAVALAVDRVELAQDSIGLARANIPISGNHLTLGGAPGSSGNDAAYQAVDVPRAQALLAEIGYRPDASGILRNGAGRPLVLTLAVPTGSRLVSEMTAELRSQLLDAGIVLRIRRAPLSQLLSGVLPTGHYQLALVPTVLSPFPSENATYYEDPVGPLPARDPFTLPSTSPGTTTTTSTTTTTTDPKAPDDPVVRAYATDRGQHVDPAAGSVHSVTRDVLGYADPSVNSLLASAFSQLNPVTMASLYNQADRQIWADLPSLPLFQVPTALVGERTLLNLRDSPTSMGPLWNAENWAIRVPPPTASGTTGTSGASGSSGAAGTS